MANVINDYVKLPDVLLIEIFLRSPVECLVCAKCVSKHWYNIIVNPDFALKHLQYQKSRNKGHLLLEYYRTESKGYAYALFDDENLVCDSYHDLDYLQLLINGSLQIEGPIDGLFSLSNYDGNRIVLSNLAMMKFKPLPLPHFHFSPDKTNYDGSICLGIDPSTHSYKLVLVRAFHGDRGECYGIYISLYKHATNTWKLLYHLQDYDRIAMRIYASDKGFFLNGIYYWGIDRDTVIAFDMLEETFREISGPDTSHSEIISSYIALYNDMVAVLNQCFFLVEIWVMLEQGIWIKQFSVTSLPEIVSVFGIWKNYGLFFTAIDYDEFGMVKNYILMLSDFKTRDIRMVGPMRRRNHFRAYVYYKTLVSVYHRTEHKGKQISIDAISNYLNRNSNPYIVMEEPHASLFDQRRVD